MGYVTKNHHTSHNCLATPGSPILSPEDVDPGSLWQCDGDHETECEAEWSLVWEVGRPCPYWRPVGVNDAVVDLRLLEEVA